MIRKQEWLEIFTSWEASGLSQTDFCKQNGINLKSFYARKAKYKNCWKSAQKTGSFIEVTQRPPSLSQVSTTSTTFQAQLADGTMLVFPVTVDPAYIADILSALRNR